jgi:hypothetical protein
MADALTHPEQVTMPMSKAMVPRLTGILFNGISAGIFAAIGRALSGLAPKPATQA